MTGHEASSGLEKTASKSHHDLLPGILVMNYKYFPDSTHEAPKNGDTAFVMATIQVLKGNNAFCGMLLYKKDENALNSTTNYEVRSDNPCCTIIHNAKMDEKLLRYAILAGSKKLAIEAGFNLMPMLYYQDERLLASHPDELPLCITHHGPFYNDFIRHFPRDALLAFGGDEKSLQKAEDLRIMQEVGIEQLLSRRSAFVLQLSSIQGRHLQHLGFDPKKIFHLSPPIHSIMADGQTEAAAHLALNEHAPPAGRHLLFTAVARLSHFKNIEILIDGAVLLLSRGLPITILIAGGDDGEAHSANRVRLLQLIPPHFRGNFKIVPKLSKSELYRMFASEEVRKRGVFVCSSRYETLGITPLEAALSGITTVIQDQDTKVEATVRVFPLALQFMVKA